MITQRTSDILTEVLLERLFQDHKWDSKRGWPRNDPPMKWLSVLAEEFGEYAMDVNDRVYESGDYYANMRNELLQCAAVCVAAVEDLDRQKENNEDRRSNPCTKSATTGLRDTRVFSDEQ